MDRYRDRRSPERGSGRERYAPSAPIDSYIPPTSSRASRPRSRSRSPGGYRPRSRTPPRPAADSYRGRPSSPTRRFESRGDSYSSPRDARPRSPRKDYAAPDSRTQDNPPRPRSPARRRSPPRDNRTNFRARSRSPRREDRLDPHASKFPPRSQSPRGDSGKDSSATSRRSSPRGHLRRPADATAVDDGRDASSYRSPRTRSPPVKYESPASRTRTPYRDDTSGTAYPRESSASLAGPESRDRPAAPAHSSSYRDSQTSTLSVPTGPSSSSVPSSAHSRTGAAHTASYGRGGFGGHRGRGGPVAGRGQGPGWGVTASYSRAGSGGPPSGPAASSSMPSANARDTHGTLARRGSNYGSGPHSFRGGAGNGTSLTTPRTQRFSQAMSGLPEIKAGGEKLPALHDTGKADRLEEEAARLRKLIDDKEMKKRQGLKEWDRLERDSANAALRSELAEEHLRSLNGNGEGMAAAF